MARKKGKEADSKAVLLEAAWQLLLEQGAAGMSVDAIVARAKLSKGTFFHFFPAKRDLLDAVCARIADESWRQVSAIFERTDLDPVARFDLYLRESRRWRSERAKAIGGVWHELTRDENATLMKRVRALSFERLAPAMVRLFTEARDVGAMRVADPEVAAPLVLEWMNATVEGSLRLYSESGDAGAVALATRRANATLEAMERVLGTSAGALRRVDKKVVVKVTAGIPRAKKGASHGGAKSRKRG